MSDKVWIKFCMYTAHEVGERRHPQAAILATYPDATNLCPESIADAWFFRATPREGAQPKPFSLAPCRKESPSIMSNPDLDGLVEENDPYAEFTPKATAPLMAKLEEKVELVRAIDRGIERLEERIKRGRAMRVELMTNVIPALCDEAGQEEFVLSGSGLRVKVVSKVYGNIPAPTTIAQCKNDEEREAYIQRRGAAMAYLDEHAPDLIKRSFDVQFSREERKLADKFERDLMQRKVPVPVLRSEKVEPQTLKKWLDTRAESGKLTEQERKLFAVHDVREVTFEEPGKGKTKAKHNTARK